MSVDAHESEFNDLKDALLSPNTMLYHLDCNSSCEFHTDASKHSTEAMLAQWDHGQLRLVNLRHVPLLPLRVTAPPRTSNFLL